ncbi:MAG: DUF3037 domain-containing protein [Kouleothrix sp.]
MSTPAPSCSAAPAASWRRGSCSSGRALAALAPWLSLADVERHLALIPLICTGGPAGGPIGMLPLAERFHWLVAPRSTIIQTSPVHAGLCATPAAALDDLLERFVLPL